MPQFAIGKKAFGFCDRCGFRRKLTDLRQEFVHGEPVNNRVCKQCWDRDHEQNFLDEAVAGSDAQALMWSRPDLSLDTDETSQSSRALFSWRPVGANIFPIVGKVGKVRVVTS